VKEPMAGNGDSEGPVGVEKGSMPFGFYVFDQAAMEQHLPAAAFKKMCSIIRRGGQLDPALADTVAFGMKEWAMSKGARCYTHWFHPLTERTARKYDAFLTLRDHLGGRQSGRMLSQFSGKQLIQGEPDGSSFPSGGLRRTAEARGYTGWDYTSPPFVVVDDFSGCLYLPAVFCSIFGLSLDQRTPMLKSEHALKEAALRSLRVIVACTHTMASPTVSPTCIVSGHGGPERPVPSDIYITVGAEQEMFIIDRELFTKRPDLATCGRILLGAPPAKGQQMADHYWARMPVRVREVLKHTQEKLWALGIPVITAHNEVAPAQFEMASNFERASVASDHNMVIMELLEEQCAAEGLACLLHEKPLGKTVNGSGKHLNWSMATDTGENLLVPGEDARSNIQFLFILAAFLRAAHVHSDVLRTAIAPAAGNEFRLGGMEAPPAVISVYLGERLQHAVDEICKGHRCDTASKEEHLDLGIPTLPKLVLDSTDRNRTSPLAFVGNRFEFRAVGSSQNCAWPITALNTIVAESLLAMCDEVERLTPTMPSPSAALQRVIRETLAEHRAILFEDDCYDEEYIAEMVGRRKLPNVPTAPGAFEGWNSEKNRRLFSLLNVMNEDEIEARGLVWAEHYCQVRALEARTLIMMVETNVIPAAIECQGTLATNITAAERVLPHAAAATASAVSPLDCQKKRLGLIVQHIAEVSSLLDKLKEHLAAAPVVGHGGSTPDALKAAHYYHDTILADMDRLRVPCDTLETIVDRKLWPFPTLTDICAFL